MILVQNLICEFPDGEGKKLRALSVPDFSLDDGGLAVITGPSGTGKTTFLHCLSGMLTPSYGDIVIDNVQLTSLSMEERCRFRAEKVGYVFQKPLLLSWLTVKENIRLSAKLAGRTVEDSEIEVRQFGVHSIAVVQVHDPAKLSRQLVPSLGTAIVRLQSKRRQGSTRAVMQIGDSVSVKLIQPRNDDEWQSILSRWTQTVMHGSLSEKHAGATGVQGHGECARYYVCTWETCRGPQGMGIESYEEERPKYFGRSRTVP